MKLNGHQVKHVGQVGTSINITYSKLREIGNLQTSKKCIYGIQNKRIL